jgi:hypothetical protein
MGKPGFADDRTLGWIGLSSAVGAALAVWGLAAQRKAA